MINLTVLFLALLFALLSFCPLMITEDACAYMSGDMEMGNSTLPEDGTEVVVMPVCLSATEGDTLI